MVITKAETVHDFVKMAGWQVSTIKDIFVNAKELHRRYVVLVVARDGSEHLFNYTNTNRLFNKCKVLGIDSIDSIKSILVYERKKH